MKRRFFDALKRKSSRDHDDDGLGPGNLQTLKAVAALAAVAGGMGGGTTDPDKTVANGLCNMGIFS
ncbi:unnamed protein product [Rodentolepis nana]|uniref:Uncharacterized protein n=1 Tax=Rodentolepis nana TaxID=102285 RepID=A0A3P7VL54_RODNA|nr:unnamed protein product [Rodentolepis nana]